MSKIENVEVTENEKKKVDGSDEELTEKKRRCCDRR